MGLSLNTTRDNKTVEAFEKVLELEKQIKETPQDKMNVAIGTVAQLKDAFHFTSVFVSTNY